MNRSFQFPVSSFQNAMSHALRSLLMVGLLAGTPAFAQDDSAATLDELLEQVRTKTLADQGQLQQREAEFAAARDRQAELLAQARARRDALEKRGSELEGRFDTNKREIDTRQGQLDDKLGALKELFGIFQQTSGDLQGIFFDSPISAQYPDRTEFLEAFAKKMSRASEISTIDEIERLWFELQREMTETGKIVRFSAPVLLADGSQGTRDVIRLGAFDVVSTDPARYLSWRGETQSLAELKRQPGSDTLGRLDDYADSRDPVARIDLDPTGGSLLERLVEAPGLGDRIEQGGLVGYVILALGAVALLVALERLITLSIVGAKVSAQRRQIDRPQAGNPLGRVLMAYHDNTGVNAETLEMKLGEAVLKELPGLNRFLTFLKIIAVAAPLLGLLGTVTGMINTFQAITLFGTGDPKTMAGGISQALVTTVLGLCVAIPTVFLHSICSTRAKAVVHMLQEQSAGLIAQYMEKGQRA
ncbi:MotA/TolQ/ExbB proton channel family protein [Sinimarinibacterium flocculans]|uniref:Biopolymer transport protein ExbB n=2 Tax=Sinimarinibacterium flocculans TaxID=985250 RepID=A0A318DYH1_9GAMM|nr:MotA/TolQ/ExbB proton channel family protein [Sinimarinibacterium flocculans]PXV62877.1 biopolymer transport protein ExbB [Sinimarinibacterium flocculans]